MRVLWTATGKKYGSERAGDREFIWIGERREKQKGAGHVDGSREKIRLHDAGHALRVEKNQAVEEFNFVGGTDAFVEVFKISTAAERNMLAIVYVLAIRQSIGSCAAAEIGPLLKKAYAKPSVSQRDAGRQTRQPAANHDHVFRGHYVEYAVRILLER